MFEFVKNRILKVNTYVDGVYKANVSKYLYFKYNVLTIVDWLFFGCSTIDYFAFLFDRISNSEKKKYATWRLTDKLMYRADKKNDIDKFDSKLEMYKSLHDFIGRDQLFLSEATFDDFIVFVKANPVSIYKPVDEMCGNGIHKVTITQYCDLEAIYKDLVNTGGILDGLVVQHSLISSLNPSSVNTVRVFTLRTQGKINFIGACLRCGAGKVVDNFCAGGMVVGVDLNNGRTLGPAQNEFGEDFEIHPITGMPFGNIKLPNWDKVIDFVYRMACVYDINYVAWDIAITEDGVDLIEANTHGGAYIIQIGGGHGKAAEYKYLLKALSDNPYDMSFCNKLNINLLDISK